MNTIKLRDALRIMDMNSSGDPKPFKVKVVKYNRAKKTGGGLIEINAIKPNPKSSTLTTGVKHHPKERKNPNHNYNATRNIEDVLSGEIRKIHIWLILEFNGKKVMH